MEKLTVTPEAAHYIKKNGSAVTVRMASGKAACCSILAPRVELRRPVCADDYKIITAGGVDLYLQNGLSVLPDGIVIGLLQFLWIKKLEVHGLEVLP